MRNGLVIEMIFDYRFLIFSNLVLINDVIEVLTNSINFSLFESNILNVASNQNYNINQIIKIIEKTTNNNLKIKYLHLLILALVLVKKQF